MHPPLWQHTYWGLEVGEPEKGDDEEFTRIEFHQLPPLDITPLLMLSCSFSVGYNASKMTRVFHKLHYNFYLQNHFLKFPR